MQKLIGLIGLGSYWPCNLSYLIQILDNKHHYHKELISEVIKIKK